MAEEGKKIDEFLQNARLTGYMRLSNNDQQCIMQKKRYFLLTFDELQNSTFFDTVFNKFSKNINIKTHFQNRYNIVKI